jgi:hypothetical protein
MPKSVERELNKMMDDFVYTKNGERKPNRISIDFLKQPCQRGGLKLIDLEAHNEGIELMKAKDFFQPMDRRPLWALLADTTLAKNAVRTYRD